MARFDHARAARLETMVAGLRARRGSGLRQFYEEFGSAIRAIAMRYLRDEHDAEEVLHDVAWTVYRKIDRFGGESDFWRWVHVVTRNAALMHLRRARRHPTPYDEADLHALRSDPSLARPPASIEASVAASLAAERLDTVLNSSSELNRRLFQRMVLDGRSVAEVADETGLSVPATKSRLHRLRIELRAEATALGL